MTALIHPLALTLLHFLWQGTAVAIVYSLVRQALGRAGSRPRYAAACACLAVLVMAPLITWFVLAPPPSIAPPAAARLQSASFHHLDGFTAPPPVLGPAPWQIAAGHRASSEPLLASLVVLWMFGVVVLGLRTAAGWFTAARLPRRRTQSAPAAWQLRLDALARRMRLSHLAQLLASAAVASPVVVGWLRPTILVPVAIFTALPPQQLEAVLVHELAHIHRHDYLVNLLQSVAETLLFYHPAVWWISSEIRAERECCCDDLAAAAAGDPLVYAHALLALETGRLPRPALASTGGSLARRITRLLGRQPEVTSPAPLCAALLLAGLIAVATAFPRLSRAQAAPLPHFDVASVKPNNGVTGRNPDGLTSTSGIGAENGRFFATDATLRWIITTAYGIQDYQLIGGDDHILSEHYDIEAHAGTRATNAQLLLMARALIGDRFQFRYHLESRPMPVYVLTLKNPGHLPPPAVTPCHPSEIPTDTGSLPVGCGGVDVHPGRAATIAGGAVPMPDFVNALAMLLQQPITDKTGISTPIDVNLTFANPMARSAPSSAADAAEPIPSLGTVLEEKLGIRLESIKDPIQVIVIDHLARPTPN